MSVLLAGSLGLSALVLVLTRREAPRVSSAAAASEAHDFLDDATGARVRLRHFSRIASNSILADRLLLELAEPERIVGLSHHGMEESPVRFQYGARASIDPNGDLEALIALKPDLLLVNNFADRKRIERLRDAGVVVFELGEMRGLDSLLVQMQKVAVLLGAPERGRELAHDFVASMRGVAADIPAAQRKRGLYVGVHGTQMYGGAPGTSYHDVLVHAGLTDCAAGRYKDWPAYTSEDLLALDPDVIVTGEGQREVLCQHASLSMLRACGGGAGAAARTAQVVEIDPRKLVDPGLTMLDVTVLVREAVYGPLGEPPAEAR
ncbi:MAG TPA: ABC transporter substrate-binding protein [Polyangiales bacterium]|nr:ABC transporter substrate-binding protein [Polyangiales bacterium]